MTGPSLHTVVLPVLIDVQAKEVGVAKRRMARMAAVLKLRSEEGDELEPLDPALWRLDALGALPLIVAASSRADDVEVDRLIRSAPRHALRVPDYWGLAEGLKELATYYLLEQLDLAASYWQVMTFREQGPLPSARKAQRQHQQQQEQRWQLTQMQAY